MVLGFICCKLDLNINSNCVLAFENYSDLEINIELTRADYMNWNRYIRLTKAIKVRTLFIVLVAFALPFIVDKNEPFELLPYLTMVLLGGIVFGVLYMAGLLI